MVVENYTFDDIVNTYTVSLADLAHAVEHEGDELLRGLTIRHLAGSMGTFHLRAVATNDENYNVNYGYGKCLNNPAHKGGSAVLPDDNLVDIGVTNEADFETVQRLRNCSVDVPRKAMFVADIKFSGM